MALGKCAKSSRRYGARPANRQTRMRCADREPGDAGHCLKESACVVDGWRGGKDGERCSGVRNRRRRRMMTSG